MEATENGAWQARGRRIFGGFNLNVNLPINFQTMPEQPERILFKGKLARPQPSMSHNKSHSHSTASVDEVRFGKGKEVPSKGRVTESFPMEL